MNKSFYTALLGLLVAATNGYAIELTDKVDFNGEIRAKDAFHANYDYDSDAEGDDHHAILRSTLGFTVKPVDMLDITISARDWRLFGGALTDRDSNSGKFDLYQAHFTAKFKEGKWKLKVGRQEVVLGTGRLFSNNDGYNGLVHDAAIVTYATEQHKFHLIEAKFNEASIQGTLNQGVDQNDNYGTAFWYNWTPAEKRALHAYLVSVKLNSTPLDTTLYTLGGSWDDDSLEKIFYGVELALQFGQHKTTEQDISAMAFHGNIGGKFGDGAHKVWLDIDYASGNDEDGKDDGEFNNLFGKNSLSLIDFVAWRNVIHGGLNYQGKFKDGKLTLDVALHSFQLASEYGNIYGIDIYTGAVTKIGTGNGDDTDMAAEFDIAVGYDLNEYLNFSTGLAYFAPGDGLGTKANGDSLDSAIHGYVGATAKF